MSNIQEEVIVGNQLTWNKNRWSIKYVFETSESNIEKDSKPIKISNSSTDHELTKITPESTCIKSSDLEHTIYRNDAGNCTLRVLFKGHLTLMLPKQSSFSRLKLLDDQDGCHGWLDLQISPDQPAPIVLNTSENLRAKTRFSRRKPKLYSQTISMLHNDRRVSATLL